MRKKNENIFVSLVKKYIAFVILVIVSIILTIAFVAYEVKVSAEKGYVPKLTTSDVVKSDYKNINTKDIEEAKGWVEILDANFNVIYTKGNKKDDYYSYSKEDIANILNMESHYKYLGVMHSFNSEDGEKLYCLIKYPSDFFNYQINLEKTSYKTGSFIYINFIKGAIFFLFLCIINIILFSRWTSKKINKPLIEITNGIKKMAQGDLNTKMEFNAEKEFAVIRDSFNSMSERLKNSEEEKEKIQQGKTKMLVDLSHDIKTPISTIQCFSKALYEGMIEGDEKKLRYYHTIYAKSERVNELIDDLFEFVKLENADYKPLIINSDFCEFIRKIIAGFYDEMEEKNYDLDIRIPEKEIIVGFDEKIMNRAISNLLSNALKYNPHGTKLRIEIKETSDGVVLEIGDTGCGIPNQIKDIIFDPFVRGDKARKSDGGSGLGLAIAKKIIEKHNGKLELYTNVKDEKTTFIISLYKELVNG